MAVAFAGQSSLKDRVGEEEWQVRVELAALYRMAALERWDDLIFTHISARVPGPEHHFLINPFGLLFGEMTASSLVKVDVDGNVLEGGPYNVNPAGFVIHSALHMARDDARFVMHLHTKNGGAVSAQREGLLPLTQHAMIIGPRLAYHDYEGLAFDLSERQRLAADLGDKSVMLLRNHGTLAIGPTAAACWLGIYILERACESQVAALSAGRENVLSASEDVQAVVAEQTKRGLGATLAWRACLRRLEQDSPGYDE